MDPVVFDWLPDPVEVTGDFAIVSERILFPDDTKFPETIIITPEIWKKAASGQ